VSVGRAGDLVAADATGRPRLTKTTWLPGDDGMSLRDWLLAGRHLGLVGRNVAWWIGDWLRYGNQQYGERYARAASITGYDVQSLMNMVYVASRFTPDRRRDALSWSHHAEVAALDEEQQERWLEIAAMERMSVRSLRAEVRTIRRLAAGSSDQEKDESKAHDVDSSLLAPSSEAHGAESLVCPHCSQVFQIDSGLRASP